MQGAEIRSPGAHGLAWVNAKKQSFNYFSLNRLGIDAGRQLDHELKGKLPIVWGGSLQWTADPQGPSE